jgi:type II secretory pathway pseudopilin PulG
MDGTRRLVEPRSAEGITLVESLLAVLVLSVIASLIVLVTGSLVTTPVQNACSSEAHAFNRAMNAYKEEPAHGNAFPGGTVDEVATVLFKDGLFPTNTVKYGVDGRPAAHQWGFDATTGLVSVDPTCSG